jgi:hypothetical protein
VIISWLLDRFGVNLQSKVFQFEWNAQTLIALLVIGEFTIAALGTLSGRSTWEDLEGTNDDPFNAGAPYSVDPRFSGRSSTRKRDYRHRSLNPRWWFSEMVLALINKAATQTAGGKS